MNPQRYIVSYFLSEFGILIALKSTVILIYSLKSVNEQFAFKFLAVYRRIHTYRCMAVKVN